MPAAKKAADVTILLKGLNRILQKARHQARTCGKVLNSMKCYSFLTLNQSDATQIIAYHVVDTQTGGSRDSQTPGEALDFNGDVNIRQLLSGLIDRVDPWVEDSNYRATVVLKLDEVTALVVGEALEDVSDGDQFEFIEKYWAGVLNVADVDTLTTWREWELDFSEVAERVASEALREAREIEREKAEGVTNLARLKTGDVLKVITKRLNAATQGTMQPRYSQQDLDERFIDTWKVVEESEQPLCEVKPDMAKIRLMGGGRWTTRNQNPVQKQERAITPSWGYIYPGQHILHWVEGEDQPTWSTTVVESIEITTDAATK